MAIFGKNDEVGGTAVNHGTNFKAVSRFTLVEYGAIKQISLFLRMDSGSALVRGVIYSDVTGTPTELKAVSDEINVTGTVLKWYDSNLYPKITLKPGDYWLGMIVETASILRYLGHSVTGGRKFNADTYSDGPTDPFGGGVTTDTQEITTYVTYIKQDIVVPPIFGSGAL